MPEGDTLHRVAAGLRPFLVGRPVTAARARVPGPQVGRIVGRTVTAVDALGKNLLIRFDDTERTSNRAEFATDGTRLFFTIGARQSDIWAMALRTR